MRDESVLVEASERKSQKYSETRELQARFRFLQEAIGLSYTVCCYLRGVVVVS